MTTRHESIRDIYFVWLIRQIDIEHKHRPRKTYNFLFNRLMDKEFVWVAANDDNRAHDGKDLRDYFAEEIGLRNSDVVHLDGMPISVLEVLIALSKKIAWQAGNEAEFWAWQLIVNLDLQKYWDPIKPGSRKAVAIEDILDTLIWRTYNRNGVGGFFPLLDSHEDQTKVEIWYQMAAYIREMNID